MNDSENIELFQLKKIQITLKTKSIVSCSFQWLVEGGILLILTLLTLLTLISAAQWWEEAPSTSRSLLAAWLFSFCRSRYRSHSDCCFWKISPLFHAHAFRFFFFFPLMCSIFLHFPLNASSDLYNLIGPTDRSLHTLPHLCLLVRSCFYCPQTNESLAVPYSLSATL